MQASYRQKCKFTSLLPEAVCCCLQTCNRRFVMRVIRCTSVPILHDWRAVLFLCGCTVPFFFTAKSSNMSDHLTIFR